MFNLSFYIICWLGIILLCLPIVFSGLFAVAFEKETVLENMPLSQISAQLDEKPNNIKELLKVFLAYHKTCKSDDKNYSLWLDIIARFAINMNLMSVDEVVNFKDILENANPNNKNDIKDAIGKSLQQRENKQ